MSTFRADFRQPDEAAPGTGWVLVAWFGALLAACYGTLLWGLARQWATDEEMSHGFFVPAAAIFIAWRRRTSLGRIAPVPNYLGLALAAAGGMQMLLGTLTAQIFIARTAFLLSLAGAVLFNGGTRVFKILAFPLALLVFMFPIPAIVYARLTLPLQLFASGVAESALNFLGVPALRDGNVLELANQRLSVVEACSGIRSLLSLGFLALIYGYFFDRRLWMRGVLLAATVPIAIAANAARVTLMGLLGEYRAGWSQGFPHLAEGWFLFATALTLVVLFHRAVDRCLSF
ncbi:MAG TPA: exosortase/archaeosortase family protein [Bryobacteraceae bacterium]|nr:exosortase/archaeosortase family protein [Bryobacteraceae bacterium]